MARFFYTLLVRTLAPAILLWMYLRAGKRARAWEIWAASRFGYYPQEGQPFQRGYYPQEDQPFQGGYYPQERQSSQGSSHPEGRIWIHAVSLGETRAVQPLLHALLKQGFSILLTHTTPTGRAEGNRLFLEAITQGKLCQAWLPYDFPGAVRRFFNFFRPCCGILMEREVWPNLIHAAKDANLPLMLINARLPPTSVRTIRWGGRVLREAYASLDLVLAQTPIDAERLLQVGVRTVQVVGNLKFEAQLSPSQLEAGQALKQALKRPVVAIASTREGEDALFLEEIQSMLADVASSELKSPTSTSSAPISTLYMLIPRHPQRFQEAALLLQKYGIAFIRRSMFKSLALPASKIPDTVALMLGDSLGEMAFYFAAAEVAIIGGGFAPLGGQNLIEACAAGTPVIVGPHMFNFEQATEDAIAAGAAIRVLNAREALHTALALLQDTPRRVAMQAAALRWTTLHCGATQRTLDALQPWFVKLNKTIN